MSHLALLMQNHGPLKVVQFPVDGFFFSTVYDRKSRALRSILQSPRTIITRSLYFVLTPNHSIPYCEP